MKRTQKIFFALAAAAIILAILVFLATVASDPLVAFRDKRLTIVLDAAYLPPREGGAKGGGVRPWQQGSDGNLWRTVCIPSGADEAKQRGACLRQGPLAWNASKNISEPRSLLELPPGK
jgi:hypothetical protein